MKKTCICCGNEIERPRSKDRRCRSCFNARQRIIRAENKNRTTHRYEKTKKGFLMRSYHNMKARVTGVQKNKFHLYQNLTILPREEFYSWSLLNPMFHSLFEDWERSGYERKLTPSVDRIDPYVGYELYNMRWVTFSFNCRNIQRVKYQSIG